MSSIGQEYLIREARKEDCEQMFELILELAEFERAFKEVTVPLEHFKESGFGEQPVWWAYVAEHEHKIIGMALYYIRYSTWKGQRLYLEDIIVTKDFRCKRVGHQLMERLIECAKERNLSGIVFQVLEWNRHAINFYKKFGATFDEEWLNGVIASK